MRIVYANLYSIRLDIFMETPFVLTYIESSIYDKTEPKDNMKGL